MSGLTLTMKQVERLHQLGKELTEEYDEGLIANDTGTEIIRILLAAVLNTDKAEDLVFSDAERCVLLYLFRHTAGKAGRHVDGHAAARLVRRGFVERSKGNGLSTGTRSVWYELTKKGENAVRLIAK